jgi:hypothetical protein
MSYMKIFGSDVILPVKYAFGFLLVKTGKVKYHTGFFTGKKNWQKTVKRHLLLVFYRFLP